jgi:four helix bundle protein
MTTRFEDLLVWQRARHLTADIYRLTRAPSFQVDRALANQLQRAAVSVMSNIAEGFERNSPGDYHRFLIMAKGSCGEIRAQLYVALDVGYITEAEFASLSRESSELGRMIGGLAKSVAHQRDRDPARGATPTPR